jgi:hypothetical protein
MSLATVTAASELTAAECPACRAVPGQACDRTVIGMWAAFPLPAPWTWWHGPVYVHVHEERVP